MTIEIIQTITSNNALLETVLDVIVLVITFYLGFKLGCISKSIK